MSELKTLKDFEEANKEGLFSEHKVRQEVFDLLKQEATKDIKAIEAGEFGFLRAHTNLGAAQIIAVCDYIRWKFNVTEYDLIEKEDKNGESKKSI